MSDYKGKIEIVEKIIYYYNKYKNEIKFKYDKHRYKYFYKIDTINRMLQVHSFESNERNTKFINYDLGLKYYNKNQKTVVFQYLKEDKIIKNELKLPYEEVINFVLEPYTKIKIKYDKNENGNFNRTIRNYKMDEEYLSLTQNNLDSFKKQNKGIHNGSIMRVTEFEKVSKDYECKVERAKYFDQVRTNLTLDFPLDLEEGNTLRVKDLDKDRNLKSFSESILVNSIGISATIFFKGDDGEKYFFLKPRQKRRKKIRQKTKGVSVFEDMFGTISGVLNLPKGVNPTELTDYAICGILRELERETNIGEDSEFPIINLQPLAFVRELGRGGKPQFMFCIEIFPVTNRKFKKLFKKSVEGIQEFSDGFFKNYVTIPPVLSPEVTTNIIYTLQYLQKRAKQNIDTIKL